MANLTVVVPAYNTSKYIRQCLDSLIDSEYKDFECILVNDESTDNTLEICKEYAKKDSRFRILDLPHGGLSNVRNQGINATTTEYVTFLDSDDYVGSDYYKVLMNQVENCSPTSLVMASYTRFDNNSNIQVPNHSRIVGVHKLSDVYCFNEDDLTNLTVNKIYKTELIKKNCLKFEKNMVPGEDLIFNMQYLATGAFDDIVFVDNYGYFYRFNPESLSAKHCTNFYDIKKLSFDKEYEILLKANASNEQLEAFRKQYVEFVFAQLRYTVNKNNKESFSDKMRRNTRIMKTENVGKMLRCGEGREFVNKYFWPVYCLNRYFPVYIVEKIVYGLFRRK